MPMTNSATNMRTPEVAAHLGVSKSLLEKLRVTGCGPRYAQVGRAVIYRREWLDEWLTKRVRSNASEKMLAA